MNYRREHSGATESRGSETGAGGLALLRFALLVLIVCVTLFVSAGTLNWPMAWAYVALALATTVGSRLLVLRRHPDLLVERSSATKHKDAKSWDRALMPIVSQYGPLAVLIVCGLDRRFVWSPTLPPVLQMAAFVALALGNALGTWSMVENRFFSALVRIQLDRGHTVVDSGPYRCVRHPAYAGSILTFVAGPLALGSLYALIPALLTIVVVVLRTAMEDRTLLDELDGYKEYARRVRFRLLPGIW
jgi:protein-S-isoprenylcysteine O-methyltransferase Ste14